MCSEVIARSTISMFLGSKVNADFDLKLYVKISKYPVWIPDPFINIFFHVKIDSEVSYYKYFILRKIRTRTSGFEKEA